MTADLSALIARLKAAEVGDDDLTIDVLETLGLPWTRLANHQVTKSLDAALALAERIVPSVEGADHRKSEIRMQYGDFGCNAYIDRDTFSEDHVFMGSGKTPALALCAAILRAKQGEGE